MLAEVLLCKKLNWGLEFVSVGYGAFEFEELLKYLKAIKKTWGKKLWLNIGSLEEKQIKKLKPIVEGISLSIETVNWPLRKKLCPSKKLGPMLKTLELGGKYGFKKSITLILGVGESRGDFEELKKFIKRYKIDRITFYRLKRQKGTLFENKKELSSQDYAFWVKKTRENFPELEIIVGSWLNHLGEIEGLLKAGANHLTKFPSIKLFGTKYAGQIEESCKKAGRKLKSELRRLPKINWEKEKAGLSQGVLGKLKEYLKIMEKNIKKQKAD